MYAGQAIKTKAPATSARFVVIVYLFICFAYFISASLPQAASVYLSFFLPFSRCEIHLEPHRNNRHSICPSLFRSVPRVFSHLPSVHLLHSFPLCVLVFSKYAYIFLFIPLRRFVVLFLFRFQSHTLCSRAKISACAHMCSSKVPSRTGPRWGELWRCL